MSSLKRTFMAAAAVLALTAPVAALAADPALASHIAQAGADCGPACMDTLVRAVEVFHQQTDPALCLAPEVRLGRTLESCQRAQMTYRVLGYVMGGLAAAGYVLNKVTARRGPA